VKTRRGPIAFLLTIIWLAALSLLLISCGNYADISLSDIYMHRTIYYNYEPNDSYTDAQPIEVGVSVSQEHSLYPEGDTDWVSFYAEAGRYYVAETYSVEGYGVVGPYDVDTYIYAYGPDGSTILAEDDDSGTGKGYSKLSFKPAVSGIHFIRIVDYNTANGFSPARTGDYVLKVIASNGMSLTADGLWNVSTHRSHDADGISWYYGVDGSWTYDTGAQNFGALTTDPIDLPAGSPRLHFWEWCLDEPGPAYEYRWVQVSPDNGVTWDPVYESLDDAGIWIETYVDLTVYAGTQVLIRFFFDTLDDVSNNYEGWYVDEVYIE
jgi:hypothetical protein